MARKPHAWVRTAALTTSASVVLALGLTGVGNAGAATGPTKAHQGRTAVSDKQDYDARQGTTTAARKVIPLRAREGDLAPGHPGTASLPREPGGRRDGRHHRNATRRGAAGRHAH